MSAQKEEYTLGIEEEYQIVDPETRGLLARRGHAVQLRAQRALGEEAMLELLTSQVEGISPVCRTLAEVRAEISRLRREVNEAAKQEGSRIATASTHPFSHWREQRTTPKERYKGVMETYRRLAREEVVFGFHVHVGFLGNREAAVRMMNRLRVWLGRCSRSRPTHPSGLEMTRATPATAHRSGAVCRRRGRRGISSRAPSTTP